MEALQDLDIKMHVATQQVEVDLSTLGYLSSQVRRPSYSARALSPGQLATHSPCTVVHSLLQSSLAASLATLQHTL